MLTVLLATTVLGPAYLEPGIWTDGKIVGVATRVKNVNGPYFNGDPNRKPLEQRQAFMYTRGDRFGVMCYDRTAPAGTEFWTWCESSEAFPRSWWPSQLVGKSTYAKTFGQTSVVHQFPFPPANASAAGWATIISKGNYLTLDLHAGQATRITYSAPRFRRVGGLELVAIGGVYKDAETQIEIGSENGQPSGYLEFAGKRAMMTPKYLPGEPVIEVELMDAGTGSIVGHGHVWYAPTPGFAESLIGASERVASDRVYAVFTSTTNLWKGGLRRWLSRN